MAGDWIKVENCTPDKPEVIRLASILGIDQDAVVGKLIRIWIWADQQTYEGNAPSVTKTFLDRCAVLSGFGDALEQVGWLSAGSFGLTFPNFEYHNGQTAKTRALTARRVRKHKSKGNAEGNAEGNAKVTLSALTREEKRREEKNAPLPPKGEFAVQVKEVFSHYQTLHPQAKCLPGSKTWNKIRDRLKDGYSVEDLTRAINGNHQSPHHCGQNETKTKYQSLELICRDAEHVQKFIEFCNGDATFKQRVYDEKIDGPYNPNE